EYKELFEYADKNGIIAFSSPFDEESNKMLHELDMPLFKIASCDICNVNHLRQIAGYGKPIILSTGASTIAEIEEAINAIFKEGNYKLILLACTLSYPTKNEDANLARIQTLQRLFPNMIIGFSDHTPPDQNMVIPSAAVALGARVIEKHYTLDRTMTGSGHFFAINPTDLKKMVDNIRLTEKVMGNGDLGIAPSEEKAWNSARRSIVAEVPIKAGEIVTQNMLGLKRPATGLLGDKFHLVVGKKAIRDISADEQINLDMLTD
ncbi:MAG: N-acetylneuraminate synthase family protein, partial [Rectinema sp.]